MQENYIGDYLREDVEAFCRTSHDAGELVLQVRGVANNYAAVYWPILILGPAWFAYRGMMKDALKADGIKWIIQILTLTIIKVYQQIEYEFWIMLAVTLVYHILLCVWGPRAYWKYIKSCLDKRNLKGRFSVECSELAESLSKEGKGSLKTAILYAIFVSVLTRSCIVDFITTVYWTIQGFLG